MKGTPKLSYQNVFLAQSAQRLQQLPVPLEREERNAQHLVFPTGLPVFSRAGVESAECDLLGNVG